jgi:hypothetical protein
MNRKSNEYKELDDKYSKQDIRDGLWQFFLDHGTFNRDGSIRVFFIITSKGELWYRINSRIRGQYKRVNAEQMEKDLNDGKGAEIARAEFLKYNKDKEDRVRRHSTQVNWIKKNGSVIDKILLWCYFRIKDRLFKQDK